MFALPGIIGLVIVILARPLDFVPAFKGLPLLYVFFALALFGYVLDLRLRYTELRFGPQLPWALGFLIWCIFTAGVLAPHFLVKGGLAVAILLAVYFLIAHAVQTFRAFQALAVTILACSIWIAIACVHQGLQPRSCVAVDPSADHSAMGRPDGRRCEIPDTCYIDPPEPQAIYRCEHAGMLGITSIAKGRVRYVGVLHDPNEAALAIAVALPFAIALYHRRRSRRRLLLIAFCGALFSAAVVMSQSRGGLLVLVGIIGVYFVNRYRMKGIIAGALFAMPLSLLGGRGGKDASASTVERLECWFEGMEMFRGSPLLGVGYGQFTEHHFLTAHNSLVLAAAEGGLIGTIAWTTTVYMSVKIPLQVLRTQDGAEAEVGRTWALAVLASMGGMVPGALFLSFNYHLVLWIYFGLAGSLWACVRRHSPGWTVRFGIWDALILGVLNTGMLAGIFVYTRMRLG